MTSDELKRLAAEAALEYIKDCPIIGVGTGSTVNHFIDLLADLRGRIEGAVSSSVGSTERLKRIGIPVMDLNNVGSLEVYVDGADEVDPHLQLIKGGGGALTREKIIAAASRKFICIADESKYVDVLGKFPLPIEVIPMARSYVARQIVALGGRPAWREHFVTDNGNHILDVHNLNLLSPVEMERALNNLVGVVTNGLFALRPADVALLGGSGGIRKVVRA